MMNNNEILKTINLINENKFDEAKQFLQEQLLKSQDKKEYNVVKLVKNIIGQKDLAKTRPVLANINFTPDSEEKQFICDGYVAVKWKEYEKSLDILPQHKGDTININQVFFKGEKIKPNGNDETILNNLDKVINYLKSNTKNKNAKFIVVLFDRVFDLKVIANVVKIVQNYDSKITFTQKDEGFNTPIQLENNNVKAIILPVRCVENSDFEEHKNNTENICNMIRENN